ncbi:MAG: hypothetical protein PHW47_09390 [Lachnospira sp.]|nr:hypothetical protein [Lachnospira sp.]
MRTLLDRNVEDMRSYVTVILLLSGILTVFQVVFTRIEFVKFGTFHVALSVVLLLGGISLLKKHKYYQADLYYMAVVFVNDLLILCPIFFQLGRMMIRYFK